MAIIEVKKLYKEFVIPHERRDSVRESFVNIFRPNTYETFNAIENLSFSVKEGEFFGIIGRNGSGKSTLLKMLAGIYPPTKGAIRVNGSIAPFLELGVGFNHELSGRENVFLNGAILGLTQKELEQKYDEIVEFAELERFMDQKLKNYSSGMQVRLAFSVAIQAGADVILLDEVLAVGDGEFARKSAEKFKAFKKAGKTIVFVTHDLGAVRQFCDRVLYLKGGKIMAMGKPSEVIDKYIYEDRIQEYVADEESQKKAGNTSSHGSKEVEIVHVDFLDKHGRSNNIFMSDDEVKIVLQYENWKKIREAIFGVAIYDEKGNHLFGSSDFLCKKNHSISEKGEIELRLKIPILRGRLFFTFAVADPVTNTHYHWLDKEWSILINSNVIEEGIINFHSKWL